MIIINTASQLRFQQNGKPSAIKIHLPQLLLLGLVVQGAELRRNRQLCLLQRGLALSRQGLQLASTAVLAGAVLIVIRNYD